MHNRSEEDARSFIFKIMNMTMFPLNPPSAVSHATIPSSASVTDLMRDGDVVAGGGVIDLTGDDGDSDTDLINLTL